MKKYQCHKVVEAAKIESIGAWSPDSESGPGLAFMHLENEGGQTIDSTWYTKHKPEPGMYFVRYEDGYMSVSPAKAFEDGYTEIKEEPTDGR